MLIGYQLGLVWLQVKVKLNLRKVGFIGSYNWHVLLERASQQCPQDQSLQLSASVSFLLPSSEHVCDGRMADCNPVPTFSWVQGGERGEKKSVSPFLNSPIHPRLQLGALPGPWASQSLGPSISDTQVGPAWNSSLSGLEGMELWTPSGVGVGDSVGVKWNKIGIVTKLRWH